MSSARRRLLFIAPVMPDSGGNGLAMRQGQFLAAYARDFEVDLAVIPLAGAPDADARFAGRLTRRLKSFALAGVDTHFSLLMRIQNPAARTAAFAAYGRPSIAARLTTDVQRAVADWTADQHYDLAHIGRLYLLGIEAGAAPRVVDADEDDSRVFLQIEGAARGAGHGAAADWAQAEAANAAQAAAIQLPGVRHVFAASQADAASLTRFRRAVTVIPNTVARPKIFRATPRRPRVLFAGTLGYAPNETALLWFIKNCWPLLHRLLPHLHCDIVGGGASPTLRRLMARPGIFWHGWQQNLAPFYGRAGAVIVPLQAGGGSRIKLLEAAAYGRAIVSTTAGADGSHLVAGRDFLSADQPAGFVGAVLRALRRQQVLGCAAQLAVARGHHPARWQVKIQCIAAAIARDKAL